MEIPKYGRPIQSTSVAADWILADDFPGLILELCVRAEPTEQNAEILG